MTTETYLGDGLYCRYDGFSVWLRAPRERGDHEVALEPQVLASFLRCIWQGGDTHARRVLERFTQNVADGGDA